MFLPRTEIPARGNGAKRKRDPEGDVSIDSDGDSTGTDGASSFQLGAKVGDGSDMTAAHKLGPKASGNAAAKAAQKKTPLKAVSSGSGSGPNSSNPTAGPARALVNPRSSIPCLLHPLPARLASLERTHRALNLVFTFCCTRKHLATTFDTLRGAVEAHMQGSPLLVADVAAIKALRPDGVRFEYVDEESLRMDAKGTDRDEVFRTRPADERGSGGYGGVEGVGGAGGEEADGVGPGPKQPPPREVLFFEFVDGDLKRQVAGKGPNAEPTRPTRRLRDEDLRMPVYSQKQMTALIERRNIKFANALTLFVNRCVEAGNDAVLELDREARKFTPLPTAPTKEDDEEDGSVGSDGRRRALASSLPASIPAQRKSIPEIVEELRAQPWYTGQIVPDGHRVFEPQEAVHGELDFLMSQELVDALYNAKGITQFYAHQAEAINGLVTGGQNVVVATSTSSGKSLIYQLPVLHALQQDADTRAMYIFPTKALAQDQKRSLRDMLAYMAGLEQTVVETFDGDTPMSERNFIRDEARIIFTNPDMLHITILPQEERWRTFLKNLKYVVVDELHYYNGLLGSHVAFIMRRLRRICAAVGNRRVKFISCSATVANPEEHFKAVFGIDNVRLIDYDGSPSGRKEFLCWNTPYKDPGDPESGRGDALYECARLFCQLILRGVRVIAFCRVREQCERLTGAVKQELETLGRREVTGRVMGYRGGYTAQDRRRIESEMFEGKLLGVVATTALELGVDIGSLDAVLTWGFPYTIANLRQQSGRAGRRNRDSLSVLVGDSFPVDQHYMQNPDELFTTPNCALRVDLDNVLVRESHVQCAAYEMPLDPDADKAYFGADLSDLCAERLVRDDLGFYHCHDRFRPVPSRFVSIRDADEEHFAIVDVTNGRNVVLEELEASRATFTIYDGAIFLHQGDTYLVKDFNPDKRMAKVERVKVDWTTTQRDYTDIDPVETEAVRRLPAPPLLDSTHPSSPSTTSYSPACAYHGAIRIKQVVFGFFKVDRRGRVLDAVTVDNPPVIRQARGMWLDVPRRALDILQARRLSAAAAIHAAEHAMLSLIPAFVVSMPGDVRTECKAGKKERADRNKVRAQMRSSSSTSASASTTTTPKPPARIQEPRRKRPARLILYDAKGGAAGSGLSTKAFEFVEELLTTALGRVEACPCADDRGRGCPECVASASCAEGNEVLSKAGATVVLRALLGLEIDVDALPWGPDEEDAIEATGGVIIAAQGARPAENWARDMSDAARAAAETVVEATPVPPRDRKALRVVGADGRDEVAASWPGSAGGDGGA